VKKEVFAKIGLLDEDFFLYYEDADFSVRAKKAGFGLAVVPQCHIRHFEKESPVCGNKLYWLVISGLIFFQKNASGLVRHWLTFYFFLRRIKNKKDIKEGKKEAATVQKAYQDFAKLCQETK
jgi:GT2 family glycosyltransferase